MNRRPTFASVHGEARRVVFWAAVGLGVLSTPGRAQDGLGDGLAGFGAWQKDVLAVGQLAEYRYAEDLRFEADKSIQLNRGETEALTAELTHAESTLKRTERLFSGGHAAVEEVRDRRFEVDRLKAKLVVAAAEIEYYEAVSAVYDKMSGFAAGMARGESEDPTKQTLEMLKVEEQFFRKTVKAVEAKLAANRIEKQHAAYKLDVATKLLSRRAISRDEFLRTEATAQKAILAGSCLEAKKQEADAQLELSILLQSQTDGASSDNYSPLKNPLVGAAFLNVWDKRQHFASHRVKHLDFGYQDALHGQQVVEALLQRRAATPSELSEAVTVTARAKAELEAEKLMEQRVHERTKHVREMLRKIRQGK